MELAGDAGEGGRGAVVFQLHAWVGEEGAVGQVFVVPVRDGGDGFGDDEGSAFLAEFGDEGREGVAETEAGDPDFRLADGAEGGAGEAGEFFLGGAGGGAADLLSVDDEGFAAVVFFEDQRASVWELRFREGDSWFHEASGLR